MQVCGEILSKRTTTSSNKANTSVKLDNNKQDGGSRTGLEITAYFISIFASVSSFFVEHVVLYLFNNSVKAEKNLQIMLAV